MDVNELMTFRAGQVKALDGVNRIGGYVVLFSDESNTDIVGDFFDKNTDFYGLEDGDKAVTLWHHGLDPDVQGPIGKGVLKIDDNGVWYESQLEARAGYEDRIKDIMRLVSENKVGFSSGSPGHMVRREKVGDSHHIKAWQIAEASLTCTPCEPRTQALPLKSLLPTEEPKGKTLADHTDQILKDVDAYLARIDGYVDMKTQDGRTVSKEKRDAFVKLHDTLKHVIDRTAPKPDPAVAQMKLRLLREKLSQLPT